MLEDLSADDDRVVPDKRLRPVVPLGLQTSPALAQLRVNPVRHRAAIPQEPHEDGMRSTPVVKKRTRSERLQNQVRVLPLDRLPGFKAVVRHRLPRLLRWLLAQHEPLQSGQRLIIVWPHGYYI